MGCLMIHGGMKCLKRFSPSPSGLHGQRIPCEVPPHRHHSVRDLNLPLIVPPLLFRHRLSRTVLQGLLQLSVPCHVFTSVR